MNWRDSLFPLIVAVVFTWGLIEIIFPFIGTMSRGNYVFGAQRAFGFCAIGINVFLWYFFLKKFIGEDYAFRIIMFFLACFVSGPLTFVIFYFFLYALPSGLFFGGSIYHIMAFKGSEGDIAVYLLIFWSIFLGVFTFKVLG